MCTIRPTGHYGPTEICSRSGPTIELIVLNNHFVMSCAQARGSVSETGIL